MGFGLSFSCFVFASYETQKNNNNNNNNNNNTAFILQRLAMKLYWLKPELIEDFSMVGTTEF